MTSLQTPTVRVGDSDPDQIRSSVLAQGDADTYAQWFACLAEPMRVRLLHRVASAVGGITVGALAEALGIGQPTVSHHLRKLADVGFVTMRREGTSTVVAMSPTCCVALPQAADVVMGVLAPRPCCPSDLPAMSLSGPWSTTTGMRFDVFTERVSLPEMPPLPLRSPRVSISTNGGCRSIDGWRLSGVLLSDGLR